MAKDLAQRFPEARQTLEAIDETLGFGLSRLMFDGPEDELTATQNAQPAILAHSAATALRSRRRDTPSANTRRTSRPARSRRPTQPPWCAGAAS